MLMTINIVTLTKAYRDNSKLETSMQQTKFVPFDEDTLSFKDYWSENNISLISQLSDFPINS